MWSRLTDRTKGHSVYTIPTLRMLGWTVYPYPLMSP